MVDKKNYTSIRVYSDTKELLDNLEVHISGVPIDTYDQKIKHLVWYFKHYKNNNGDT